MALATTPAVLLSQAGRTPFSNYAIKPDKTGVTGAIVSSYSSYIACAWFEGLFAVVHFPATVGFQSPFLSGLVRNLGVSPHLKLQDYRNEL